MWLNAVFKNTWVGAVTLTALVVALLGGYSGNWRGWHRGYWAPFAVVAVALVFGVTFG